MDLLTVAHRDAPAVDMALSALLVEQVSGRNRPQLIRLFTPGPTAAFGRLNKLQPRFLRASAAARAAGLTPVLRLAGGHLACYDQGCVIIEMIRREERMYGELEARFKDLAELITTALDELGVTVAVGQLPGEYCPGRFSLHLTGGPKIAGIAQRVIRGASLTSAVIVVNGGPQLRRNIEAIYAALELPVDPAVAGAIDERHPRIAVHDVVDALTRHVISRYDVVDADLRPPVL
jgi:lipoate-protein ligase A